MITCLLKHLEERCAQRGYTLDEVRACIVSQDGDSVTVDETHAAYPRPKPVPLLEKAKNLASATAKHVAAGMPRCTDEQIEERFAICAACDHYVDNSCSKCGCRISREKAFVSKLSWAEQSCPVGKWGPVSKEG